MMFLEGYRVLDLSRILAGPLCTQILADMGAEVLKVEAKGGDDTRSWGPPFQGDLAAYYQSCNRNKASLVLDLKDDTGRRRLQQLVAVADVVVDNFPPAVRTRLKLDPQDLAVWNPKLVTMSITGYRGSRKDEPGYDVMIQAESGLMGITGPADGEPYKTGVAIVDVMTGMTAANGILAALLRRQRKDIGAALSVTLYRTALFSLVNVASSHLVSGKATPRWGNAHANITPYQPFQLADRAMVVGVGNDRQYRRLCQLLEITDPNLTQLDNPGRIKQRQAVVAAFATQLKTWQSADLIPKLKAAKIPCAPILRPDEAITRVQSWDPDAVLALDHATLGEVRLINNPIQGDGMRASHQPPPLLNQGGEDLATAWLNDI